MLCESEVEVEATPTWAPAGRRETRPDWQTIDYALRAIARRRAALDADEARWLREAEAVQIWRPLGMVSALDYLERVLGYAPRTAQDRLRVARALGSLPQLTAALASGELAFSAVRELTRVPTPATEASWVAAARDKNVREIEDLVAEHRPGDDPEDPPIPDVRTHVVRFELSAETFALLRQTRTVLDDEHGSNLPEDQFVAALCHAVLDGAPAAEHTGRARFQIAVTVCECCRQGWQHGAGAKIAISPAAVERAMCDAQHIGSIDGDAPERSYQAVPPSVVRFVWRRDGGRCRVPGCRSARGLEIHHIVHRADGGGNDPSGLALLCSSCHSAHHAGTLTISGTADQLEVRRRAAPSAGDPAHVGARGAIRGFELDARGCFAADPGSARNVRESPAADPSSAPDAHGAFAAGPSSAPDAPGALAEGPSFALAARESSAADPSSASDAHGAFAAGPSSAPDAHGAFAAGLGFELDARASSAAGLSFEGDARGTSAADPGSGVDAHDGAAAVLLESEALANAGVADRKPSKLDVAVLRTQSKEALVGLGWKPTIAVAAVAAASTSLGADATLERLIFEALRRCPRPAM